MSEVKSKIKSLDELKKIREQSMGSTNLRTVGENSNRIIISVGMATCGIAAGAKAVMTALLDEISKNNLSDVSVISTGCLGYCYAEPLVEVRIPTKDVVRYKNVNDILAREIIHKHIMQGSLIDEAILNTV